MTPNTFRNGGQNVQITYTIVNRRFVQVLVAETDKGVCVVRLGGDDASLEAGFKNEYPEAKMERVYGKLHEWMGLMLTTLDGHPVTHFLPFDVVTTAIQRRVWQRLISIPHREIRSHSQVAEALGELRPARAVANFCAANPVAAAPYHRVIRQAGGLGGSLWGMERKAVLQEI